MIKFTEICHIVFFSLELTFDITHTTHKDTQHTQGLVH